MHKKPAEIESACTKYTGNRRGKGEDICKKYGRNKVVIVVGETGSGKSTGIPEVLLRETADTIIVTQPRRVAAISLSRYMRKKTGTEGTDEIGYKVRFTDRTTKNTRLRYVTDGILLRSIEENTLLADGKREITVILDEVHERSVRTDILLGLLKEKVGKIKLVLMSATADTGLLEEYFTRGKVPVEYLEIKGRKYDVKIKYLPKRSSDYVQVAYDTVKKIIKGIRSENKIESTKNTKKRISISGKDKRNRPDEIDDIFRRDSESSIKKEEKEKDDVFKEGTVLVFLSGLEDIEDLYRMLEIHTSIELMKLHSSLSDAEQRLIFTRREKPLRVILSTNIAETSITIEDVKWVIDSGVQKINVTKDGVDTLGIVKISKSSAKQRAGRAGRVGPGVCYRLYTESAYLSMDENTVPEILRTDISSVSLSLINMKKDPETFDFLQSPGSNSISSSLSELFVLGLIDKEKRITDLGKKVAKLPLSPSLGKFLIVSKSLGVGCTGAAVCSLLSTERVSIFPKDTDISAIESVYQSISKSSDITLYGSIFFTYISYDQRLKSDFCKRTGISQKEIRSCENIYQQLLQIIRQKNEIEKETEKNDNDFAKYIQLKQCTADRLHAAASAGFMTRVGSTPSNGGYVHLYTGRPVFIHPSSVMFRRKEETVGFITSTETTKPYILHAFPYIDSENILLDI